MKIRRGIFGGALLFATAGCTGNVVQTQDLGVADSVVDAASPDAAADAASPDAAADAAVPDGSQLDGATGTDASADWVEADTAPVDALVAEDTGTVQDTSEPDAATPEDVASADEWTEDTHVGDVATADVPWAVDVSEDASDCKLLGLDNALGEKCANSMDAICDAETGEMVELICYGGSWEKMSDMQDMFPLCQCAPSSEECTYAMAICAVPGFVGLDRAGRNRVATRRLRRV